jgi:mannose-1-phosphate guanylyltransferase/mannose-6-phosphate isomerase
MLLVMPSDHFIRDPLKLQAAIVLAHAAAGAGAFVTFGITPSGPETSYGYIKQGEALGDGVFKVARFVEKPARAAAEAMLAEGGYYWNSGMFLFPVGPLLTELRNLKPQIVEGCERALASASVAQPVVRPEASAFLGLENISIDYALMEHTSRAAIVPVDPLWIYVGSWTEVWELSERDDARNAVAGNVVLHDVSDAYVRSEGPLTAVLGLSDVIVVNTGDAVIVAAKSRAQDIRHIVDAIRKRDTAK